jgi:hypothetical protein
MPSSIKKVVAEGPNFDVAVNFMDNGGVRITLPDGPWAILGPSQRARARVKSASSRSKKQRLSCLIVAELFLHGDSGSTWRRHDSADNRTTRTTAWPKALDRASRITADVPYRIPCRWDPTGAGI